MVGNPEARTRASGFISTGVTEGCKGRQAPFGGPDALAVRAESDALARRASFARTSRPLAIRRCVPQLLVNVPQDPLRDASWPRFARPGGQEARVTRNAPLWPPQAGKAGGSILVWTYIPTTSASFAGRHQHAV